MKKINFIVLLGIISIPTLSFIQDTLTVSIKEIWRNNASLMGFK